MNFLPSAASSGSLPPTSSSVSRQKTRISMGTPFLSCAHTRTSSVVASSLGIPAALSARTMLAMYRTIPSMNRVRSALRGLRASTSKAAEVPYMPRWLMLLRIQILSGRVRPVRQTRRLSPVFEQVTELAFDIGHRAPQNRLVHRNVVRVRGETYSPHVPSFLPREEQFDRFSGELRIFGEQVVPRSESARKG